jgi:hypothetical protein
VVSSPTSPRKFLAQQRTVLSARFKSFAAWIRGWIHATADRARALVGALLELAEAGINMTKVESRPSKTLLGQYIFLVDINGHREEERVAQPTAQPTASCSESGEQAGGGNERAGGTQRGHRRGRAKDLDGPVAPAVRGLRFRAGLAMYLDHTLHEIRNPLLGEGARA